MNIEDLKVGMDSVSVVGTIVEKGEKRSFISRKTGRRVYVAEAKLADETGEITLVLWNRQIEQVDEGDKISIENGYVNEYNGNPQLNVGRYGKLEKIE